MKLQIFRTYANSSMINVENKRYPKKCDSLIKGVALFKLSWQKNSVDYSAVSRAFFKP